MENDNGKRIEEILTAQGWGFSALCVDGGGYDRQSVYSVTLTRNGREYTTEFRQGCGLRLWKRLGLRVTCNVTGFEYWRAYRKPGAQVSGYMLPRLRAPVDSPCPDRQRDILEAFAILTQPLAPTLADVLYCLVSDVSSVRHGQDFAEWCSEFGEDTDSRKARKAFKGCVREWRGLVRLGADFDTLETMFQDF